MTLRVVGPSMNRFESTSHSTESLLHEVAALCAVNRIPEREAIELFSTAFRNEQSRYAGEKPEQPEIFIAAQVLSEWHQNPEFLSRNGTPRELSESSGEFDALCKSTRILSNPTQILDLLIHASAVKKNGDRLEALRREIIIGDSHPAAAARAIRLGAAFLSTLKHNLTRSVRQPPNFERTVVMPFFSQRHIPALMGYLSVHAQALLEDLDSWMERRTSDDDGTEVGVGIYFFKRSA